MEKHPAIRRRNHRLYVAEATYFITSVTLERRLIFAEAQEVERLRETLRAVKELHPFKMRAYVFLPDHFHVIMQIGESTDITTVMRSFKRNYTLNYKKAHATTGSVSLWQHGFIDHVIRDDRDFVNHMHYIHYNPVKHGLVARPEDYPHSSYLEYVKRGWYEIGWGHNEPIEIQHMTE